MPNYLQYFMQKLFTEDRPLSDAISDVLKVTEKANLTTIPSVLQIKTVPKAEKIPLVLYYL